MSEEKGKIARALDWVLNNAGFLAGVVTAGGFVVIILVMFFNQPFFERLADKEVARGLITFLVALSTVGLALILITYLIASKQENGDVVKENYQMGKEILNSMIGVLGTIIGFYFGSTINQNPVSNVSDQEKPLKIISAKVEPDTIEVGGDFKVTAEISGGVAPYEYGISFIPNEGLVKKKDLPTDGVINEKYTLPDNYDPDRQLWVMLQIKDQVGGSQDNISNPILINVSK